MMPDYSVLILANVKPADIGLINPSDLINNPNISRSIEYSKNATKVVIGLNYSLNKNKSEVKEMNGHTIKFLPNTKGALASIGLLLDQVPEGRPVVIVPTNSWIEEPLQDFLNKMVSDKADVGIAVVQSNSTDLSYVRYVGHKIVEIHEKEVVGNLALSGHYFFRDKKVILDCLDWAMLNKINKDGLLYIAPSLNYSITKGMRVSSFETNHEKYSHINQSKGF